MMMQLATGLQLMSPVPVESFPGELHEHGATRVIPLDLSAHMGTTS